MDPDYQIDHLIKLLFQLVDHFNSEKLQFVLLILLLNLMVRLLNHIHLIILIQLVVDHIIIIIIQYFVILLLIIRMDLKFSSNYTFIRELNLLQFRDHLYTLGFK